MTATTYVEGVAPVSAGLPGPTGPRSERSCQCADHSCPVRSHENRPARFFHAEDLAEAIDEHDLDDPCHFDLADAAPGEQVRLLCVTAGDRSENDVEFGWLTTSREIFLEWAALGMVCTDCLEWVRS